MYRRGFSVNSLRNSARSYYYRFQRLPNPRTWLIGGGCVVLALLGLCCLLAAVAAFYLLNPVQRSALDPLLALV